MFEQSRVERRSGGSLSLLVAGALTILGYYGLPWWAAWPAYELMALEESAFSLFDRGPVWRIVAFAVAVAANMVLWAVAVRLVLAAVRAWRRPSASSGDRHPADRSTP